MHHAGVKQTILLMGMHSPCFATSQFCTTSIEPNGASITREVGGRLRPKGVIFSHFRYMKR